MPKKQVPDGMSKSDKKVLAIATTAAKLFSSKGYIETSMEDVSAAAKISKGGMYHYFSSKCDILDFILSTFLDTVLQNAEGDLQEISDPIEKIRADCGVRSCNAISFCGHSSSKGVAGEKGGRSQEKYYCKT